MWIGLGYFGQRWQWQCLSLWMYNEYFILLWSLTRKRSELKYRYFRQPFFPGKAELCQGELGLLRCNIYKTCPAAVSIARPSTLESDDQPNPHNCSPRRCLPNSDAEFNFDCLVIDYFCFGYIWNFMAELDFVCDKKEWDEYISLELKYAVCFSS